MKCLDWLAVVGIGVFTYQPVNAFDLNDCITKGSAQSTVPELVTILAQTPA